MTMNQASTVPVGVDLSIIVVGWNVRDLLAGTLATLPDGARPLTWEAVVVDNASTDGSPEMVAQVFPQVRLIRNTDNRGFARSNNQGIGASHGEYLLLLNSDTVVPPGALAALVAFMEKHPQAGACAPRLLQSNGQPQAYAFGEDPTLGYLFRRGMNRLIGRPIHDWNTTQTQEVDWVSGACLLARREAIDQVGGLDEGIFMYFEDNDWCLCMRQAGWKVYYHPQVEITHIGGQSVAQNPAARQAYYQSLDHFYAKHYGPLARALLRLLLPVYRLFVTY